MASEDLREEFDAMWNAKATPEKYALKVRTHPGQLQITAITKMRNVDRIQVSWSGRLVETYQLSIDKGIIRKNLVATQNFLSKLGAAEKGDNYYLWRNVAELPDILKFFSEFTVAPQLAKVDLTLISNYIRKLNKEGELDTWRVALMSKGGTDIENLKNPTFAVSDAIVAGCYTRNTADDTNTYVIRKNHITNGLMDEFIDFDKDDLDKYLIEYRDLKGWAKTIRDNHRGVKNPLLLVYSLDPLGANPKDENKNPVPDKIRFKEGDDVIIGFAIVFPKSNTEHTVEFAINTALANEYYQSEIDFDDNNDNLEDDEQ